MKRLNNLCTMFIGMALITMLSACSGGSSGTTSTTSAATQGVTFSFAKDALVAAKTTGKSVASATLDPAAKYAAVTVTDTSGNTVLSKYKTDIYSLNGSYITSTIPLAPANYQLTEFLILDANNKVLYIVPTQSATAEIKAMVTTLLPISFGVTKDTTNTISLQVLPVGVGTANDYGYPSIIFDVVNVSGVTFMTDVQTLDTATNNWLQINASLKINNVDYTVNAVTTKLQVPQDVSYTLVYSKAGYTTKTITLTATEIANYQTTPLVVVLTPNGTVTRTVSFNSNGGSTVASQTVTSGGVAATPANPSRTGYTFAGWYSNSGLTTLFSFSAPITADITLYAKWTSGSSSSSGIAKIAKTGQTGCWDAAGLPIACNGTGQDGETLSGVAWPASRFTDNSIANAADLTQTDTLTGLIWTKDANIAGTKTWQLALDYIKGLNNSNYLGHNDWRLPNFTELQSLTNMQYAKPANWLNTQGFINVQANAYWSSTTYVYGATKYAWNMSMNDGTALDGTKSNAFYVWPVRGGQSGILTLAKTGQTSCWDAAGVAVACSGTGQDGELQVGAAWPANRFTDNSVTTDTTVTDNLTGLVWTKNANLAGSISWQAALDFVKNLNGIRYLGYGDWRLPNRKELESLVNRQLTAQAPWLNTQGFINVVSAAYWSSTTDVSSTSRAWYIVMLDSSTLSGTGGTKTNACYVWPVRGGQ